MKLGIMGPQGAGKGTQSKLICKEYNLSDLSTGEMIRTISANDSELGRVVKPYSEARILVPDHIMNTIVSEFVKQTDDFILDGYPRTEEQALFLDGISDMDAIIYMNLPLDECARRMEARAFCKPCGITYGLDRMPKKPGLCSDCDGDLYRRKDDNPDAIKTGLESYLANTVPLLSYYRNQGILVEIDIFPNYSPQEIFSEIKRNLDPISRLVGTY